MTTTVDRCTRCRCRPSRPGRRTCERCAAYMRTTNAQRRESKREWDRSEKARAGARARRRRQRTARIAAGDILQPDLARLRDRMVVLLAEDLGRVPTINEICRMLPLISAAGASRIRRRAFGLAPLRAGGGSR